MNVHKLSPEREQTGAAPLPIGLTFEYSLHNLGDVVLKSRAMRALDSAATRYPIYRSVRCATRRKVEDVFDDLALETGLTALRLDEGSLLLDGPGVFVRANGTRKTDYCSCEFQIWADNKRHIEELRDRLFEIVGELYPRERMFTIDWHFNGSCGLTNTSFDELIEDTLYDEAYPTLGSPIDAFIDRYLCSTETVLILQGAPGTGKTRLVRAILSALSKRKDESAKILYTGDKKTLENDEIFLEFITGSHDAFVVEDADHMLLARSNGNHDLHRFLSIADGVVRAQGRKIVFTTNLPNVSDIDDALLRPGRCFANVRTRGLNREEAHQLLRKMTEEASTCQAVLDRVFGNGARSATVADIYRAHRQIS